MYRTVLLGGGSLCLLAILAGCELLPNHNQLKLDKGLIDPETPPRSIPAKETEGPSDPESLHPETVSTVLSQECPTRQISLAECIAVALENGRTGQFFDRAGSGRRTSVTGIGQNIPTGAVTDSIRVMASTPAIVGTDIEQSLSRFDVIWQSGFVFNHFDRPTGLDSLFPGLTGFNNNTVQGIANSLSFFNSAGQQDTAQFRSELLKPLASGGVAGLSFRTDYFKTNNNQFNLGSGLAPQSFTVNNPFVFSPAYRPQLDFIFEQPLLRGNGVLINQIRDMHPGSFLDPFPTDKRVPGILLARVTYEQSKLDFVRQIHELLFTVEEAYWDLYGAYWDLHSREIGMRQALTAWQIAKQKYDKGALSLGRLAVIEEQYQNFRIQRLQALGSGSGGRIGVLEAERRLRYVLGLPAEDGTRLVPCDAPKDTPCLPDWKDALAKARYQRPELLQIQEEIKAGELLLRRAKDLKLPDLRFLAKYNINGLGHDLGSGLESFATSRFNDWELGLVLQVPLGAREGYSEIARAQLKLAQRFAFLRDQEEKVVLSLQRSYREVVQLAEEIRLRRLRRNAAAEQLKERHEVFMSGAGEEATINFFLEAQRSWIDALRDEYLVVCAYNVALVDFERQKGTIMAHDNVSLTEGPLPPNAQVRASKHIREFKRSLTLLNKRADGGPWGPADLSPIADPGPSPLSANPDLIVPPALPPSERARLGSPALEQPATLLSPVVAPAGSADTTVGKSR